MTEQPQPYAFGKRLSSFRRSILFVAPFAMTAIAIGAGFAVWPKLPAEFAGPYTGGGLATGTSLPNVEAEEPDGFRLFQFHCASCHGAKGDGDGLAALTPRARYFGYDKFKFISTTNPSKSGGGMPTDDDLLDTLKRGIPGTPMPSFGHLPEPQLRALIAQVHRFIRIDVIVARMKDIVKAKADATQEGFDEASDWSPVALERMRKQAEQELMPGVGIEAPAPFGDNTPASVARGRVMFEKAACASCHGLDGKGDGPQSKDPKFLNENGTRAYPRDLTAGLFKGGGTREQIYARVYLGIPGTPMPMGGLSVKKDEIVDLVHFVKSLERPLPGEGR